MNPNKKSVEVEQSLQAFEQFLNSVTREEMTQMKNRVESLNIDGPTIEEYFSLPESLEWSKYIKVVGEFYAGVPIFFEPVPAFRTGSYEDTFRGVNIVFKAPPPPPNIIWLEKIKSSALPEDFF